MSTVIEAFNPLSQELFTGASQSEMGSEISKDEEVDDADVSVREKS